ncbi:MAG: MATE family efflux transporter [Candidatus Omnitrophota bacterium]
MMTIALPMVVSQACDTVMIFTDRLFLSKLHPELMNAAMGGGLTVFMMMSFFLGLTGYASALTAQYLGAGRKKNCAVVTTQALLFSAAAYLPILLSRPLGHRLFAVMGIHELQLGPQKIYFDILLYGVIFSLARNCLSCFFSGIGRTGVVMTASFTAMAVNAVLNYILIFGKFGMPALGIRGAAYGTLVGGASGLFVLAAAYLRKQNRDEFSIAQAWRFDREVAKKLWRFGSSTGLEFFLNIMAFNGMVMTFHSCGLAAATAATIVLNWDMVSFVPLVGVEIGVTSLVGRYMGAGRPDIAHRSVMSGLKLALLYSSVILALFLGIPGQLIELFRPAGSDEIFNRALPTALFMLRMAAFYVLCDAVLVIFIGALRGAGDTLWAMGTSVSVHWLMVGTLTVVLRVLGRPPETGWVFLVWIFIAYSFVVFFRYRLGKWRTLRVVEKEPVAVVVDGFHEPVDL